MNVLVRLMGVFDRKASKMPGRPPMYYNHQESRAYVDGYKSAMHEAAQDVARETREG